MKFIFYVIIILNLISCQFLDINKSVPSGIGEQLTSVLIKEQISDLIYKNSPTQSPKINEFTTVNVLPGSPFSRVIKRQQIEYAKTGEMLLSSGDYIIPVMTFCLDRHASSPSGFLYSLSTLQGSRRQIIRELIMRGMPRYSARDLQVLIWSIQAGLSYAELNKDGQKIIDDLLPERRQELDQSFLEKIKNDWNKISEKSNGYLPKFDVVSNEFLISLGEIGNSIIQIKNRVQEIKDANFDYQILSQFIDVRNKINKKQETPWAKVSDQIYARFVTDAHFQEIGYLEVRVLAIDKIRTINSISDLKVSFDFASLVANPNDKSVQPLLFAPILGIGGLALENVILNPYTATTVIAAVLATKVINWDQFFKTIEVLGHHVDRTAGDFIKDGYQVLSKEHDQLEKPLKEAGIISGKDIKKELKNKDRGARQYLKKGDDKTLEEDFKKLFGKEKKASDGREYKELPDGKKAIKRPADSTDDKVPTLELQPPSGSGSSIRIKVRYQ